MKATHLILAIAIIGLFIGCEGRRALDNPDNLDNMPVEADRVEDSAGIHSTPVPAGQSTTTTESAVTTGAAQAR